MRETVGFSHNSVKDVSPPGSRCLQCWNQFTWCSTCPFSCSWTKLCAPFFVALGQCRNWRCPGHQRPCPRDVLENRRTRCVRPVENGYTQFSNYYTKQQHLRQTINVYLNEFCKFKQGSGKLHRGRREGKEEVYKDIKRKRRKDWRDHYLPMHFSITKL